MTRTVEVRRDGRTIFAEASLSSRSDGTWLLLFRCETDIQKGEILDVVGVGTMRVLVGPVDGWCILEAV